MNVKDAIAARRSIRRFTDRPVGRRELLELVEAARLSPSSCNSQPWRFRLVTEREDIAFFAGPVTSRQGWLAKAGAIIVCCVDTTAYMADSRAALRGLKEAGLLTQEFMDEVEECYLKPAEQGPPALLKAAASVNLAIAMSAMMLRAVDMGLGACWIGRVDEEMTRQRLNLPAHLGVASLLAVGWPDENPEPRPRKSLDDILI